MIPSSTVKHIAGKEVLRGLSGNIDVAVVGSGIGALSTAANLARTGLKVAVFEQNQTAGGCTHTFEKEGFEFDVGVHYVGGFSSVIRKMYDRVSDGQLKWTKLDRSYDVMYNAQTGERIEMTDDHLENRRKLTEHFGIEAATWEKFDKACFRAKFFSHMVFCLKLCNPFVFRLVWPLIAAPYRRYSLRATTEVLHEVGFSPEAAGALTYHWGGEFPYVFHDCIINLIARSI
jgi:all-trans-retinol 13,14-reductase